MTSPRLTVAEPGFGDWGRGLVRGEQPNVARVYDSQLGGSYNFAADRQLAGRLSAAVPDIARIVRANRYFVGRAVRYCLSSGMRQFLDIGCGLPSGGSVQEIAERAGLTARVAYVDIDPVVVGLCNSVFGGSRAGAVTGDVRCPEDILSRAELKRVLDLDQPVVVVLTAILHFLDDFDDPAGVVERLLAPLPAGSYLVVSHAADSAADTWSVVNRICRPGGTTVIARGYDDLLRLFADLDIIAPGVVGLPDWRPEDGWERSESAAWSAGLCGVGCKR
jgi:S-adenosyl methyltransferase